MKNESQRFICGLLVGTAMVLGSAAGASAQATWGPTTFAFSPSPALSSTQLLISATASLIVGCGPLTLDGNDVQVIGNTIELTARITCGAFNTPGQYTSSAVVGPLPVGTYSVVHFRRIRSSSLLPPGPPEAAGSATVQVVEGQLSPIPVNGIGFLAVLAALMLALGTIVHRTAHS